MTTSPFLLAVFVLAVVPFASSSKSSKNSSVPSSAKTVPATPQLLASSGVVCESSGTCLVAGSRCTRGYETCFGETFDLFVCDCVDIDGSGNLEYSCRFNDACKTAPTERTEPTEILRQPSLSSAKAGKAAKSSKGSSKSSKAYSEAQGIFYPVAPPGSAKSSKAYGSSKSSKVYESSKAAKGSSKAFKSSKGLPDQNLGYVNLFTQEPDIDIITNAPTNDPTKASTNDPSNDPTSEPTKQILRSFSIEQCTGDPCPVGTQCRSRYGNCGYGIMHCNAFSSWKQLDCPPALTVIPLPQPTAFPSYTELLTPPRPATPSPTTAGPTVEEASAPRFIAPVDLKELSLVQEVQDGSSEELFETSDSGLKEEDDRLKTKDAVNDPKKTVRFSFRFGFRVRCCSCYRTCSCRDVGPPKSVITDCCFT